MFRLRLLAFLLALGAIAGFGSGFHQVSGGGWHGYTCDHAPAP